MGMDVEEGLTSSRGERDRTTNASWSRGRLMAHLGVDASTSSNSESPSDMDLGSDLDVYEIPAPTYVKPLKPPKGEPAGALHHSQLHLEVDKFSKMLEMDEAELRRKRELIQIVTDASWKLFKTHYPDLKVQPFGGFANGLGTKRSDVDIVLTGMFSPEGPQGGYTDAQKRSVNQRLGELRRALKLPSQENILIRSARIPLLKLTTEDGIDLDISIGNHGGPEAARFIRERVEEFPVVRPLVLVVKYMLEARHLNDVATNGLGTYSLANMAIAYVRDLRMKGQDINEYGNVLVGFLKLFGVDFDVRRDAVSLRMGSFCRKLELGNIADQDRYRFCIEDYFTGNDVSGGTYKVTEVRTLFQSAWSYFKKERRKTPSKQKKCMFPLLSKYVDIQSSSNSAPAELDTDEEPTPGEVTRKKKRSKSPGKGDSSRRESGWKRSFDSRDGVSHRSERDVPRRALRARRSEESALSLSSRSKLPVKSASVSSLFATVFIAPAKEK